jgi:hypothetical protein
MLRIPHQVRNTGVVTLLLGLVFAGISFWFDRESHRAVDARLVMEAAGYSSKLFTLALVLMGFGLFEIYRARTRHRLAELDRQIAELKKMTAHL